MPTTETEPESAAAAPASPVEAPASPVDRPKHLLSALTTFELKDYRHQLEHAIALYGRNHPAASVLADLRQALGDVQAEQDDRARIARA
jgi:hypothetical protein